MDMRMMLESLSPRMENTQEADVGPEVFGVGRYLQQCGGAGSEQEIVDHFLVV